MVEVRLAKQADVTTHSPTADGLYCTQRHTMHGRKAVVETLLVNKADIHAKFKEGFTAIHLAAEKRHKAVVKVLLEHRVDVNLKVNDGRRALLLAEDTGIRILSSVCKSIGRYREPNRTN